MIHPLNSIYQVKIEWITPVNLLLHSLFSQVEVSVHNKSITSSTTNYPYKAMIQTLLKYGNEAKQSVDLTDVCFRYT